MATIATNLRGMTLPQKLNKGRLVIAQETDNPDVPGNEEILAAFAATQQALQEAVAAATAARSAAKAATEAQAAAERAWNKQLAMLASFTQMATGGDATKMIGAGFDVRAAASPAPQLGAVKGMIVQLAGAPGHSRLSWNGLAGALGYLVQGSADPDTETSWTKSVITMASTFRANGAVPGQKYWYRVAAFNTAGQGPWSTPASRPVM